ncbi:MAG: hypothetical protein KDA58_13760, partial [Planctomycetaceae bacterium]|nr:hypothetical protein [Planctomycetaceae bacterium]
MSPYHGCRMLLFAALAVLAITPMRGALAQDAEEQANQPTPVGQFLTLKSPITDESLGTVRRVALALQDQAKQENREAFLILELTPGASQFHHAYGLAEFLASEPLTQLHTIAWVPKSIDGNNVFVALACQEIVVHPDAKIGDLGRGRPLEPDQQTIVRGIVAKRRNKMVNEALAAAMMDPSVTLFQLTVDLGNGVKEKRLATSQEAQTLRDQGVEIADSRTLKEAGTPWSLSGAQAREDGILASQTANSRRDLVDAYNLPIEALR